MESRQRAYHVMCSGRVRKEEKGSEARIVSGLPNLTHTFGCGGGPRAASPQGCFTTKFT